MYIDKAAIVRFAMRRGFGDSSEDRSMMVKQFPSFVNSIFFFRPWQATYS